MYDLYHEFAPLFLLIPWQPEPIKNINELIKAQVSARRSSLPAPG